MEPDDILLVEIIIDYCDEVADALREYSVDKKKFDEKSSIRAMFAFFVLEIGENANKLSNRFIEKYSEVEWKAIIGFRHRIVHAYNSIDADYLWDAIQNDVPRLKIYLEKVLAENTQ